VLQRGGSRAVKGNRL